MSDTLVTYGNPLSTLLIQSRDLQLTNVGESTFTLKGKISASLAGQIESYTFSSASDARYWYSGSHMSAIMPLLGLRKCQTEIAQDSRAASVTLVYSSIRPAVLPNDTLTEQDSSQDEPIQNHPNFPFNAGAIWQSYSSSLSGSVASYPMYIGMVPSSSADTFVGFPSGSIAAGQTSFYAPTTQVIYTQYYLSDPGSPEADIGQVTPPPGYSGTYNWLILSAVKQQSDVYYTIEETYLYSYLGWPTQEYPV